MSGAAAGERSAASVVVPSAASLAAQQACVTGVVLPALGFAGRGSGRRVAKVSRLTDGVTNLLWKVTLEPEAEPEAEETGAEAEAQAEEGNAAAQRAPEGLPAVLLVRVYGAGTEVLIDRDAELLNLRALSNTSASSSSSSSSASSSSPLAARLFGTFGNGYVYEFQRGRPLAPADLRSGRFAAPIARQMARWHAAAPAVAAAQGVKAPPSEPQEASVFAVTRQWLSEVPDTYGDDAKDAVLKALDVKGRLVPEFERLAARLLALQSPIVFSHNDLLGPNIILDDGTGHSSGGGGDTSKVEAATDAAAAAAAPAPVPTVSFIDFEYGSFNARGFDLGNHWAEFAGFELAYEHLPSVDARRVYARHYLEAAAAQKASTAATAATAGGEGGDDAPEAVTDAAVEALVKEGSYFVLCSHFFWATWALVQADISTIDFDYLDYADKRFAQYFKDKDAVFGKDE